MVPRRGRVVVPSVSAGLLLAFSLPPWGWWPLGFLGAGLLYWRLSGQRTSVRVLSGWLAGIGCFVPGLWWAGAFNWYGAAVLMAAEACSTAAAAAFVPPRRGRLPAFVGAFTLCEAVRMSWPFGGLPLGGVFLGQAGGPLLGSARLGGPLLLTALVWLGGAGCAEVCAGWVGGTGRSLRGWERPSRAAGAGAVAVVLVVALGVAGAYAPSGGAPVRRLSVALVQGGGERGTSEIEVPPARVLGAQVLATRPLLRHPPTLVVWPEDVVRLGRRLRGTAPVRYLSGLARRLHATVVAGVTQTVSAHAFRNEAVAWGPTGRIRGVYEKVHRVPFGEYVPDRSFFAHFANLSAVPLDAIPGHGSGELTTAAGRLGLMISYEVFFATRARSAVRAGAQLLVVPTNTSSYATSQVPDLELAADRVEAVSEGRDLVQASPTGYSDVVDQAGAVLERSALGARALVRSTVAMRAGHTIYEETGRSVTLGCCALALAGGLLAAALGRRRARIQLREVAVRR